MGLMHDASTTVIAVEVVFLVLASAVCSGLNISLMSLIIAAIYVLASNRIPELKQHWIAGGLVYGAGVFVVMNYVVVPLSEIGRIPQFTWWTLGGNILAMLGFGLLIAFFARGSLLGQIA